MDYKEIGRIFYRDGYRLAHQHLEEEISAENLMAGISQLYRAVDDLLDAFLQRTAQEGKAAECRKGCSWCCHQAVFAVTHEFFYINKFVKQHLKLEAQNAILENAREKVMLTLNKPQDEQLKLKVPCPFLQSGSCVIYAARPMACRIYLSSSVKACEKEYKDPANKKNIPDLFEFPLHAGRMLNEGFVAYLKQVGLKTSELSLEKGYSSMLTMGQTIEGWIRGAGGR